jgi:dTDP-4-amino-4,6-dideoxygalactose transaminase
VGRYTRKPGGARLLGVRTPSWSRHGRSGPADYTVKIGREAPSDRDEVIRRLADHNIGTSAYFQGIHRHSFFRERYGLRDADLPHATDWALRSLSLPLHPGVSDADQDDVVHALAEALQGPLR